MSEKLNCFITDRKILAKSTLYPLNTRNTYIISNPSSRKLLCEPEIIGYEIAQLLLHPISNAIEYLITHNIITDISIVYILRGGLNFSIEDACYQNNLEVKGVSFLTSERVFLENKVSRIECKYRKINSINNATIIIGDIIASGQTLKNAVEYIVEQYILTGKTLKNIIVFTIGTSSTLEVISQLNYKLKQRWDQFEGIWTIFIEGIFTTYPDVGITRLNLPDVDFSVNGGLLAPEYRLSIMEKPHIIFEKCCIYDGGARRFEPKDHISCILKYWSNLISKANEIKIADFLLEKYGYGDIISFEEWKGINCYKSLNIKTLKDLYQSEISFFQKTIQLSLSQIAESRFNDLNNLYLNF